MKLLLSIRPKYKVALGLLMLVVILLCGVLVERNFFSRINQASASIYNDRLIPSTAIYHISDHLNQRRFAVEGFLEGNGQPALALQNDLQIHWNKTDSIIKAFEETYLVKNESRSLASLKSHLLQHSIIERKLLQQNATEGLSAYHENYNSIRHELQELSIIQTRVGQNLLDESNSLTSNAGIISHMQIIMLIITCLVVQGFILASKAISPPVKQQHHWN